MKVLFATGFILTVLGTALTLPIYPTISDSLAEAWDREILSEGVSYKLSASDPEYIVPNATFPKEVDLELSNNCVGIGSF